MKPRIVFVTLTPAMPPFDRGEIADAVARGLGPTASIFDEGTVVIEPTRSDFTIELASDVPSEEIAHDVWAILGGIDVDASYTLTVSVDRQSFSRPLH